MSPCEGKTCTHAACIAERHRAGLRASDRPDGFPPAKWASMNRAQRRAYKKGARRAGNR